MRYHSQSMVFNIPTTVSKDLFLNYALKIIGDRYVHVESKGDKITLNMQGERGELHTVINRLSMISNQINNAVLDNDGSYIYDNELLSQLFKPQLQLKYFKKAIEIYGFDAKIDENMLITNANYFEIERIHKKAAKAMREMISAQNRDIQRFFSLLYMKSNLDMFEMGNIGLENDILKMVDGKFHFAIDQEIAYKKMQELVDKPELRPTIEVPEGEEINLNDFFEGGKIVFLKNGEELDSSPFDIVKETKNREE